MLEIILQIAASPQFWGIAIPALVAIWSFSKTKEAEREAEWRKEKLKLYLEFIEAFSGITDCEINNTGRINFAKRCNNLHALAPNKVIKALHAYQDTIRITDNNTTPEEKQIMLNKLFFEIRKDLKIKPEDIKNDFAVNLWTSGIKKT
jgi:hypothetical protein